MIGEWCSSLKREGKTQSMILFSAALAKLIHLIIEHGLIEKTQVWRKR
ncbi:Uncharacterised protein [Vibrio cincinnatiensis]|uniref:Transposase n=1 Tax=Vibrio cincinnatiensis DSM 19608 TaxID=1123491 RepID=A0A1T4LIC1_VIBCI|nr:hypothetical protein SAMN02745782_00605 [Vibrio cincinnatiensis DSM 19608]SUP05998.1 Uncharacterised protein [Vibrio cincinnatiensis]